MIEKLIEQVWGSDFEDILLFEQNAHSHFAMVFSNYESTFFFSYRAKIETTVGLIYNNLPDALTCSHSYIRSFANLILKHKY